MEQRYSETVGLFKVSKLDMACNIGMGIVGIALTAFAIAMFVLSYSNYGVAPIFSLQGGLALTGIVLSTLSIKWVVEACRKLKEYQNLV